MREAFECLGSVVIAGTIGLLSAAVFGWRSARPVALVGAGLALSALVLAFFALRTRPAHLNHSKQALIFRQSDFHCLQNTFWRIDFYESPPTGARGFAQIPDWLPLRRLHRVLPVGATCDRIFARSLPV